MNIRSIKQSINQSKYKKTIITSTIAIIIFALTLSISIISKESRGYTIHTEEYISYSHVIQNDEVIMKITPSTNINNLTLKVVFSNDKINEKNSTTFEIKRELDIDKNNTKRLIFDLNKIKKDLQGDSFTKIQLKDISYKVPNKYAPEFNEIMNFCCAIIIIPLILAVLVVWDNDKMKIREEKEEIQRQKEADELKQQAEKAREEANRRYAEEQERREKEILRKQKEQREEEERKRKEEIQRRQEEAQRKFELERLRKIKCKICEDSSYGEPICKNCEERSFILGKEFHSSKISNYDNIHKYRQELMLIAINADTKLKKEAACLRLVAIAELLETKYKESTKKDVFDFFTDLKNIQDKNEIISKYHLSETPHTEKEHKEKQTEENKEYSAKDLKCLDGDIVKSKAEREIDNFFYNNKIWHIYEYSYRHPISYETSRPDFYLPDYNLFIEYFGLNTDKYIKNKEHKIEMYQSDKSINFEYLTYEDDDRLYDKLKEICNKYKIPLK